MSADSSREFFRAAAGAAGIERRAADWIALRETRALSPAEAAAFAAWRAADPRHEAAVAELDTTWAALDGLRAYPRPAAAPADPEFFSHPRSRRVAWLRALPFAAAAAAVVALAAGAWLFSGSLRRSAPAPALTASPTTLRLEDGSEVELRPGSEVAPQFTAAERRVRLVRGEAHFTVAKNPARPFVVEAGGVAVRAVGTAFNVRLDPAASAVAVLVTEGVVRVGEPAAVAAESAPTLTAGQRTTVAGAPLPSAVAPVVETLAPAEIDRELAWQSSRLVFDATPLAEVIARFAGHGGPRLVLADPALAALPISGRFRAANAADFIELLESGFGVAVERRPGEIVLRRAEK
jgi:transmembrane sensor